MQVSVGSQRSRATFINNTPLPVGAGQKDVYSALFTTYLNLRKRSGSRLDDSGELVISKAYEAVGRFASVLDGINKSTKVVIDNRTFTITDWDLIDERKFYYKFQFTQSDVPITITPSGEILVDMPNITIFNSRSAITSDAFPTNYIFLNGSSNPVDFTIDPVAMDLKTFKMTCEDNTNRVRVLPASGTINGSSEYEFGLNEEKAFYCKNGNIIVVP
jgi:hypothetical protein